MSYHMYQTEALILGSSEFGESGKVLTLFTRELGFVRVAAQGVRALKSKLRFALQDFSIATVWLVEGKNMWRLANAEPIVGYEGIVRDPRAHQTCTRIASFARRLLQGEGRHDELYETLRALFVALPAISRDDSYAHLEIVVNLRMLAALGYGSSAPELEGLFEGDLDEQVLARVGPVKRRALAEINAAMKETQL